MAIFPTGVAAFDNAVLLAEATRQAALAVPGLTGAQADAADKAYYSAVLLAAAPNNTPAPGLVSSPNALTAQQVLNATSGVEPV